MTEEVNTILVLGLGVMGNGIAHVAAQSGFKVHGYDIKQEFVDKGLSSIEKNLNRGIKRGKITEEEVGTIMSRITGYTDLEAACKEVDFVIEAVIESIPIKLELFEKINGYLDESVVIASNTSTLPISLLAGGSGRSDRFIGMHFFNPPPMMKLVEIIKGIDTSDSTYELTEKISKKMNKTTIVAKDSPGFIVNRILLPFLNEAVFALQEGVGTVEDIDTGAKLGLGHPMGPLTLLDLIGLDTAVHVSEAFYHAFQDSKYRVPYLLKNMVAAGKLGRKSGEGFYKY